MKYLKVDSSGGIIFHNHYRTFNDFAQGGVRFSDSLLCGFGQHYNPVEGAADSHVQFINEQGDSVRLQTYNIAFNDRIHDLIVKNDSTFIALGLYSDTLATDFFPYVANLDTSGNVRWLKTHNNPTGLPEFITNMVATADGGYVFAGEEYETSVGWLDKFLYKVDSLGSFVWKKTYHEPQTQRGRKVSNCSDGGFFLCGTGYATHSAQRSLIKTDSVGNIIWDKKFGTTQYNEDFHVARELPNKNIICAGSAFRTYNNQDIPDINLTMLDSAGNLIWSKDYTYHGLDYEDYVRDMIITSDGGFAVTGFILNAPNNQGNDLFILKTDGNGLITSLESGFVEITPEMKVYPNPTQDVVNVPYSHGLQSITLFTLNGQLLQQKQVKPNNSETIQFDISNYAKGIYLINLEMESGKVFSKKIVKK